MEPKAPFGELSDNEYAYSSSQILADGTVIAIDRYNIDSRQIGQFTSLQESTIEQQAPTPLAPVSGSPSPATTNIVPLIAVHDPGSIGGVRHRREWVPDDVLAVIKQ